MEIIYFTKINKKGSEVRCAIFNNIIFGQYYKTQYYNDRKFFLHQYIYCYFNNLEKIPEGFVIHHRDFNKLNNDISNLELMSKFEHKSLHGIGKKHAKKVVTEEMINDVKNGMKLKLFKLKYIGYNRGVFDKLKKKYKNII